MTPRDKLRLNAAMCHFSSRETRAVALILADACILHEDDDGKVGRGVLPATEALISVAFDVNGALLGPSGVANAMRELVAIGYLRASQLAPGSAYRVDTSKPVWRVNDDDAAEPVSGVQVESETLPYDGREVA